MIETLPWLLIAALIIGIAKGGLASAAALAVPFLAIFMNPLQAAALVLPVLITTDVAALWLYRKDASRRNVLILLPAMFAGIALATLIVPYVSEPLLLAFTGCVGLWAVFRRWFQKDTTTPRDAEVVPGLIWGGIAGVTTFITHSGAPPTQAYLLPQNLPRMIFAGTMAITFALANFAKIPSYYALGFFDGLNWGLVAGLAIVGLIGVAAGRWLVKVMSDKVYTRVIEVLLLMLSLILLTKAGLTLFGAPAA
ncbi:MAG: sulfite exporter TauE/SafE family protein [Silicimonas sp.]|nr:sulfite exporter TauE/SafE family protein [Silicimonas sp.]